MGCVPILMKDHYVAPFSDVLNWKSFSVEVSVKDIPNLKTILMGISRGDIRIYTSKAKLTLPNLKLNLPNLSVGHLGSDLCRGILEFAEERPLGKSGLQWLKIHMANLYAGGVDKFSYEGRIAFTENHLDDIFDSADRSLEGRRWWLGTEDPFQCLATCINLAEALRSSSPETTISYMPIHQDGSCNGLQHYAALGRDKKPADVYSGIAARVLDIMRGDAKKDPATDSNASLARLLINQTTLTALGEMFEAARSIMSWLGDCAKPYKWASQLQIFHQN
ncbi:hypothetical protein LOK49_LG09G01274 [Camellia lanceoleosa]|uniref:Uncharacterized protein n=1 Tax=Camellia lanceoleosa TaxID=1840588 RepID=A0ACC0GEV7_9ERIC|nr:hypothetical protein LOK49_LG09G01274 [Camellia lanceoleosa]